MITTQGKLLKCLVHFVFLVLFRNTLPLVNMATNLFFDHCEVVKKCNSFFVPGYYLKYLLKITVYVFSFDMLKNIILTIMQTKTKPIHKFRMVFLSYGRGSLCTAILFNKHTNGMSYIYNTHVWFHQHRYRKLICITLLILRT